MTDNFSLVSKTKSLWDLRITKGVFWPFVLFSTRQNCDLNEIFSYSFVAGDALILFVYPNCGHIAFLSERAQWPWHTLPKNNGHKLITLCSYKKKISLHGNARGLKPIWKFSGSSLITSSVAWLNKTAPMWEELEASNPICVLCNPGKPQPL